MEQIATIDSNHIVGLFNPDEQTLRQLASSGMMSLVNFKAEGDKGLSSEVERKLAEAAGLNYMHVPMTPDDLSDDFVDDFRRSLDDLPQPVFLHCVSGQRAAAMTLMALAADKGWNGETALSEGAKRGIDLSEAKIGRFVKAYADQKAGI